MHLEGTETQTPTPLNVTVKDRTRPITHNLERQIILKVVEWRRAGGHIHTLSTHTHTALDAQEGPKSDKNTTFTSFPAE